MLRLPCTDAEAAFKKLTAAFEKLNDPVQQAASRADAERTAHRDRSRNRGSPPHGSGRGGNGTHPAPTDANSDVRADVNSGRGARDAPRWCREGEYIPEQKRKEEEEEVREARTRKVSFREEGKYWEDSGEYGINHVDWCPE